MTVWVASYTNTREQREGGIEYSDSTGSKTETRIFANRRKGRAGRNPKVRNWSLSKLCSSSKKF
jgi:hypothetical protein